MADDELGVELLRLYRELRAAADPRRRAAIQQLIDATLDRAERVFAGGYAGVTKDRHG
jgi:hypothetical protein